MKKKMNKRYDVIYEKEPRGQVVTDDGIPCTARTCCTRLNRLEEENQELKRQMNRLYNYFMDWHSDEMGGNQFSEMWDMVKEDEKWDCE